jgi:hypothetical protein
LPFPSCWRVARFVWLPARCGETSAQYSAHAVHQLPPLFQEIAASVGGLDLVVDRVRQRFLHYEIRK